MSRPDKNLVQIVVDGYAVNGSGGAPTTETEMLKFPLFAALAAASMTAGAGTYWHPEADGVVLASPPGGTAEVCYLGTSTSLEPAWTCIDVDTDGAKTPIYLSSGVYGPVRVKARWAYAETIDGLVPMAEFNE